MPRPVVTPATPTRVIRAYLGVTQATLAGYLGLTRAHVASLEAGRRTEGLAWPRLSRLLALLPPPWGSGPPDPAPPTPAPLLAAVAPVPAPPPAALAPPATARALRRAHRQATQTATNLRGALLTAHQRAATVARQRAALAALEQPDPTDLAPARTARLTAALRLEIDIATGPGSATDPAALGLATLRLWLLETEAAALAGWLTNSIPPTQ